MTIQWNDAMSVGNADIDNEHKQLIKLINQAEVALEERENHDALLAVLGELVKYTRYHFDREEIIQLNIKYPDYVEHKLEHQELVENLEEFMRHFEVASEKNDEPASEAVAPGGEPESASGSAATPDVELANGVGEPEVKSLAERNTEELMGLLRHWIIDHVLTTDRKMKPYLKVLR